jgi:hypothetical protein
MGILYALDVFAISANIDIEQWINGNLSSPDDIFGIGIFFMKSFISLLFVHTLLFPLIVLYSPLIPSSAPSLSTLPLAMGHALRGLGVHS